MTLAKFFSSATQIYNRTFSPPNLALRGGRIIHLELVISLNCLFDDFPFFYHLFHNNWAFFDNNIRNYSLRYRANADGKIRGVCLSVPFCFRVGLFPIERLTSLPTLLPEYLARLLLGFTSSSALVLLLAASTSLVSLFQSGYIGLIPFSTLAGRHNMTSDLCLFPIGCYLSQEERSIRFASSLLFWFLLLFFFYLLLNLPIIINMALPFWVIHVTLGKTVGLSWSCCLSGLEDVPRPSAPGNGLSLAAIFFNNLFRGS